MKQKNIFIVLSMFMLVFTSIMGVIAVSPFQSIDATGQSEYIIEFPKLETFYFNNSFEFRSHVVFSNGTALTNIDPTNEHNVSCSIEIYNLMGVEVFDDVMIFNGKEFESFIPNSVYNYVGDGYYVVDCLDENRISGITSNPFNIVSMSEYPIIEDKNFNFDFSNPVNIVVLVVLLIGTIILLYYGYYTFAGIMWFILGFMMLFSGINYILSGFVIIIGAFMGLLGKD